MEFIIASFAALFSVVNPIGAIPVYMALTPHYTKQERNKTSLFTAIYFVAILLVFFVAGNYILSFFGISLDALRIAGGLVILSSGYALLSGKFAESRAVGKKVKEEALKKDDISFAPMAMPMLSGPGSISLLISMYAENPTIDKRLMIAAAILLTGVFVWGLLRTSPLLMKVLGVAGIKAISRIMGFIVMAIGVQYIIAGIVNLVTNMTA